MGVQHFSKPVLVKRDAGQKEERKASGWLCIVCFTGLAECTQERVLLQGDTFGAILLVSVIRCSPSGT